MTETILGDEAESKTEDTDATLITEPEKKEEDNKDADAAKALEEEKKAEEAKVDKDSDADTSQRAPDVYDPFKLPEGMEVNPDLMKEATDIFKDLNLTQDQAQKLVEFDIKRTQDAVSKEGDAWTELTEGWKKESNTDKEFGGANLEANLAVAKKGRDAFGNKEFTSMLEITGVGNHPEMIRFLFKLGSKLGDDKILQGSNVVGTEKDQAHRLFPEMK